MLRRIAITSLLGVAAQPGQDTLPDNICEDVKVYDYAQKKCIDPGASGTQEAPNAGPAGDARPAYRLNSFIEELACDCYERECSCGRKCDCKPPPAKYPAPQNIVSSGSGGWGGSCTCPDGTTYWVGDNWDACASLACTGGTPGNCIRHGGQWSGRKVQCAPPSDGCACCRARAPMCALPLQPSLDAHAVAGTSRSTACATACCATASENATASWPPCTTHLEHRFINSRSQGSPEEGRSTAAGRVRYECMDHDGVPLGLWWFCALVCAPIVCARGCSAFKKLLSARLHVKLRPLWRLRQGETVQEHGARRYICPPAIIHLLLQRLTNTRACHPQFGRRNKALPGAAPKIPSPVPSPGSERPRPVVSTMSVRKPIAPSEPTHSPSADYKQLRCGPPTLRLSKAQEPA